MMYELALFQRQITADTLRSVARTIRKTMTDVDISTVPADILLRDLAASLDKLASELEVAPV